MNQTFKKILFSCVFIAVCHVSPASADPKPWIWSWWPGHWQNQNFQPYIEHPKQTHNSQWDGQDWEPQDWIAQREEEMKLMEGFYKADILRGQHIDDDIPVLVVGPGFYQLGGQDRRRLAETVDSIYGITTGKLDGFYWLEDDRTDDYIGSYTKYGLQLQ